MKINFTKKEYRALVQVLHLGDWILHAHETRDNPETEPFRSICQKVYSHYKEMGCEDIIERSGGEFYGNRKFEDSMHELIDAYDEESFWEELTSRMAIRDAAREVGEERLRSMDSYERMEAIGSKEQIWANEFEEHGITRLVCAGGIDG